MLNASRISFNDMNLRDIRLKDTDLSGGKFIRANMEGSHMTRVKIASADFTEANLRDIDWQEIQAKEVQIHKGHTDPMWSIAFSPSGFVVATGRKYSKIRLVRQYHKIMG